MPTNAPYVGEMAKQWLTHFQAADREMTWLEAEKELSLWLDADTLLLGKVDAIGRDGQGNLFFGEWKTANPREKSTWKAVWRMNPQSLTYGVLVESAWPGCRRFTVRKAFKSDPPVFDHAWFSYTPEELTYWRAELRMIASEIRQYRLRKVTEPWPTNFKACFKYGPKYACPFFEPACSLLKWDGKPNEAITRVSHLESERRLYGGDVPVASWPELVVLDATRVVTWLDCRERYRREYEEEIVMPVAEGEALWTGIMFHDILGQHYAKLAQKEKRDVLL